MARLRVKFVLSVVLFSLMGCAILEQSNATLMPPPVRHQSTLTVTPVPQLVDLTYSDDSETIVIFANTRPGIPYPGQSCNYIPDLRIWGDGRIVSVNYDEEERHVRSGHISSAQIREILTFLYDKTLSVPVTPEMLSPAGTGYDIGVDLNEGPIWRYWLNKPPIYTELMSIVDSFDLPEFVPQKALLVTGPYLPDYPAFEAVPEWPAEYNFSLDEVEPGGRWIEGEIAEFVWQAINTSKLPVSALREQESVYAISLQISGISEYEPPVDCWGGLN